MVEQVDSTLESFVVDVLKRARENFDPVRTKWLDNLRALAPKGVVPTAVGTGKAWKNSEKRASWQSDAKFNATLGKVQAAHDFADDIMFKDGEVPFRCRITSKGEVRVPVSESQANPEQQQEPNATGSTTTQDVEAEKVERFLDFRLRDQEAVSEFMSAWDDSATFGERFIKVRANTNVRNENGEKSGIGWSVHRMSPFECIRDMETAGDIKDGEYFIVEKRMHPWRVWQQAKDSPDGLYFDFGILSAALNSDNTSAEGASNVASSDANPSTSNVINRSSTTLKDEVWIWAPRKLVDDFRAKYPGPTPKETDVGQNVSTETDQTPPAEQPPTETGEKSRPPDRADERVWVLCYVVNDKLVGFENDPGPLPYRRGVWSRLPEVRDGVGIPDLIGGHQHSLDGLVRSLDDSLKLLSTIIIAVTRGKLITNPEEMFSKGGIGILEIEPETANNINECFQSVKLADITPTIMAAIKSFTELVDLDSNVPRIQQGQGTVGVQTAFELQQRLEQSGKHMGSKVRDFDSDIEWALQFILDAEIQSGNIVLPDGYSVEAGGFAAFTRTVTMFSAIMQMLQLAGTTPEIAKRIKWGWTLWNLAKAQNIPPSELWLTEDEVSAQEAAAAQSPEVAAQMQMLQAELAKVTAAAGKDEALAQKALADAQAIVAKVQQDAERIAIDRAQAAHQITEDIRNRQERRLLPQQVPPQKSGAPGPNQAFNQPMR